MREILVKLWNVVQRAKVDRPGKKPQIDLGANMLPDVEYMEPQGVHFAPPAGAQGVLLAPNALVASAVSVCLSGAAPSDTIAPGEGGLHYLGTFKVFASADGKLHLGAKTTTDFIARASLVDARISALETAFNAHVHTSAAPASPTSPPTVPLTPGSSTASANVGCT